MYMYEFILLLLFQDKHVLQNEQYIFSRSVLAIKINYQLQDFAHHFLFVSQRGHMWAWFRNLKKKFEWKILLGQQTEDMQKILNWSLVTRV